MSVNPITGVYESPLSALAGLPTFDGPRRWDNPPGTLVGRALGRGIDIVQQNLGSAVEGVGNVLGLQPVADFGARVAERNAQEIAESRAMENDNALSYVVGLLGENVPQLALSVAGPLIGGVVRGAAGVRAGLAASGAMNYAMLAGEAREAQREELARRGLDAPINEAAAFGAAVPAAAVETLSGLVQARLAARVARAAESGQPFFSRATARSVAGAAARGAAVEGPTEAIQQGIMRAQAGQSLTDQDALADLLQAGLAGAILGGTLSGGARTVGALRRAPEAVTDDEIEQTVDQALTLPPPAQPLALPRPDVPSEALTPPPNIQPPPVRPLQQVDTQDLVAGLMAAERRLAEVNRATGQFGGIPADARTEAQTMRAIRAEIAAREQEQGLQPGALLAPARGESIATPDQLERERAQQLVLFREMTPEGRAEIAAEQAPLVAMRQLARRLGLSPSSRFYRELSARTPDELYDAVLDGLDRAASDTVSPKEGRRLEASLREVFNTISGGPEGFPAKIAAAEQARDAVRARTQLRTPAAIQEFTAANRKIAALREQQRMFEAALQRLAQRRQAAEAAEAQARADAEAAAAARVRMQAAEAAAAEARARAAEIEAERRRNPLMEARMTEAMRELQIRQAEAQRAAAAEAEIARRQSEIIRAARAQKAAQQEADLALQQRLEGLQQADQQTVTASPPAIASKRQREAFLADRYRNQIEQAAAIADAPVEAELMPPRDMGTIAQQRLAAEQNMTDAEIEQMRTAPARIQSERRRGNITELTMHDGTVMRIDKRRDGFYLNGARVGRTLDAARAAARRYHDAERGLLPRVIPRLRGDFGAPGTGMAQERGGDVAAVRAIEQQIAAATRDWAVPPGRVTVVARPQDLPAEYQESMGSAAGFVTPEGNVYIVASAHQHPTFAVATLFHEVLGHRGLRALYGRDRAAALEEMYDTSPRVRELVEEWQNSYPPEVFANNYGNLPLALRVEEALATMSESGPIQASWLDRMRKIVADFARRLGLRVRFSEAQLRAIMADAHARAMAPDSVERDLTTPDMARAPMRPRQSDATPEQINQLAKQYGDTVRSAALLRVIATARGGTPDSPKGDEQVVQRVIKAVKATVDRVANTDVREAARASRVYYQSLGHLVETYGRLFPMTTRDGRVTNALREFQRGRDLRASVREIIGRVANHGMDGFAKLSPAAQQDTLDLMSATFLQLDPEKDLQDHTHLTPQERAARRADYAKIREARNRLARDGNLGVYRDMVRTMRGTYLQQHTLDLYDMIRRTPEIRQAIPAAQINPILKFAEQHRIQGSPEQIEKFWQGEFDAMVADIKRFLATQSRPASGQDSAQFATLVGGLRRELEQVERERRTMDDYPYFHLGRFGRYYATFQIRTVPGQDGKPVPDPVAVRAIQKRLVEIGFDNVVLSENAAGATVFIRTETPSGADQIQAMAREMIDRGFVDDRVAPKAGEVDPLQELPETARQTLESLLAEVEAQHLPLASDSEQVREAKAQYVAKVRADLQAAFLARLPDSSVAKVMARRSFRAGFDKDMLRAFALRMQVASNSAASRLAANITGDAIAEMTAAVSNARQGGTDKWAMTTVLREVVQREVTTPDTLATNFIDQMRALNHNYFLAWSPGYWLTQITQLQTNLWPELVKGGASFKDAFGAIQRSFGISMAITKAVLQDAKARGFGRYGADATVTTDVLDRVQLSSDPAKDTELKQFVLRMYLRGVIDIGSASRELGRVAEGRAEGKFDLVIRWASSSSYYLEMTTRLTAALAARDVALKQGKTGNEIIEYAAKVVREAMLDYTESNRARAFGKQGLVGQFTPLATAFLSFQFLMLEKYSREIGSAFGAYGADPAERAASRRWLGTHLASMAVLAGSLGLPFVTVIARVIDALGDMLTEDEAPFDVKAAYRNFLADIFGQEMGEVLARGLPRAIGFDVSGRIGAADILPFSQLIADRREWDEALKDMADRSYGSAFSMLAGMLKGADRIADGYVLDGMREALPVALRNPLEAVRITREGVVDRRGNLLPVEPNAMMVIWQALGLTPAERAEYTEANFTAAVRRGVLSREATRIRQSVARAVQSGDRDALRDALRRVREFDANAPMPFQIGRNLATALQQAVRRREIARAQTTPLGLAPQDLMGQNLVRFADF